MHFVSALTFLLCLGTTVLAEPSLGFGWNSEIQPNIRSFRNDPDVYHHVEDKPRRRFVVEWEVKWQEEIVRFKVTAQTRGWVGFGLSASGRMFPADMVIAGVNPDGNTYLSDRHSVAYGEPLLDAKQDWHLEQAGENGTHTVIVLYRAFETCDQDDLEINEYDTVHLIWAYGESDNCSEYHHQNRGSQSVYLLDPNIVPPLLKDTTVTYSPAPPSKALLAKHNLNVWTVSTTLTIPDRDTTHVQHSQGTPPGKEASYCWGIIMHKQISFHARLNDVAERHVHHLLGYRCTAPSNTDPADFFGPFLNVPPEECYFLSQHTGRLPTQTCSNIVVGWGIGGMMTFYPDQAGIPVGETGPDEFYVFQVHYDNPSRLSNVRIQMNMDLYYTSELRPNDAGLITVGHQIPGSPSIHIPPSSLAHHIYGHCGDVCTAKLFPAEGIKVTAVILHTHTSGRKVTAHHFRGDQEQPWLHSDENYNNRFQNFRILHEEVVVRPGDHLMIRCENDNTWTNGTVMGGFSTSQEMCLAYLLYYTRIPDFGLCRSEIVDPRYRAQYLGVRNITWSEDKLEYVATEPASRRGMSMTEISNELVDWTIPRRQQLQQDHKNLPQFNMCSRSIFSNAGQGQTENDGHWVATPSVREEYVPRHASRECRILHE